MRKSRNRKQNLKKQQPIAINCSGRNAPEETKRKRGKSPDYEKACSFRKSALQHVQVNRSIYAKNINEKITKIVQVIGKNQVSLFSYIDNVLTQHFVAYQDEITELYNKNNESIFLTHKTKV